MFILAANEQYAAYSVAFASVNLAASYFGRRRLRSIVLSLLLISAILSIGLAVLYRARVIWANGSWLETLVLVEASALFFCLRSWRNQLLPLFARLMSKFAGLVLVLIAIATFTHERYWNIG